MSTANLEVSLLAPECTLNVSFTGQWLTTNALPLGLLAIFVSVACLTRLKWYIKHRLRARVRDGR